MSEVEILKVHFLVGKYLYIGQSYVTGLINDLVKSTKLYKPSYIHLTVHTDINKHYEEFGFLTILDTIHRIDLCIEKYASIFTCTAPKRIQARSILTQNYISTNARMHCPSGVSIDSGPQLLFIPKKAVVVKPMDLFVIKYRYNI